MEFVVDALVLDEGITGNNFLSRLAGIGLKQQHATPSLSPVSRAGLMAGGNEGAYIGPMGRNIAIKGCFVHNAALNFDKPWHW
jgi:hypothetical protein